MVPVEVEEEITIVEVADEVSKIEASRWGHQLKIESGREEVGQVVD